jgi:hypothetical protein
VSLLRACTQRWISLSFRRVELDCCARGGTEARRARELTVAAGRGRGRRFGQAVRLCGELRQRFDLERAAMS